MNPRTSLFKLVVRQQPSKARLCSFKEKVDRRPIDPPPIIQLLSNQEDDDYLQNPYFFLYATLTDAHGETDLHFMNGNRTTAGTVVQSLHKLKDHDNTEGGFFIFSDISVRLEGFYRLKFTLYEIEGLFVHRLCSIVSDVFQVFSPKSFPGMSESTFLTRSFSDQGVRIRIRKEPRSSSSNTNAIGKRRKRPDDLDSDEDGYTSQEGAYRMEMSPLPRSQQQTRRQVQALQPPSYPYYRRSPSPLPEFQTLNYSQNRREPSSPPPLLPPPPVMENYRYDYSNKHTTFDIKPILPSPKEIFRSSPMSMQNLLSSNDEEKPKKASTCFFPPTPVDDEIQSSQGRLFATRVLPLPLPSQPPHAKNENKIKHGLHSTPLSSPSSTTTSTTTITTTTITTTTPSNASTSSSPWLHHHRGHLPAPSSSLSPPIPPLSYPLPSTTRRL